MNYEISDRRARQDTERETSRLYCAHRWEYAEVGGVIVGLSRCSKCGTVSRESDFAREAKP